jgi:hypothetical protein
MTRIVAVLTLLAVAGCEPKQQAAPAAADTAVARSAAPDTAAPMVADSIMVRDTAAVP